MTIPRNQVDETKFNRKAVLPFELRLKDFGMAMQDVYLSESYFIGKKVIDSGKMVQTR